MVNERALRDWDSFTGKLKDMCGSPHMEIGGDIHPQEKQYGSQSLWHLQYSQINTSGKFPQIKQKQVKDKRGSTFS